MEINVNVNIKRYLEVELNKLEEEKTKLDGRLEDITRQINLYEQLIATYDHVEEEVRKIIEEPVKENKQELVARYCGTCKYDLTNTSCEPCRTCVNDSNRPKWTEKNKTTAEQVFVTQELTNHFCAEPKKEEKKEKATVEQFVEKNAEHIKKIVTKGTKYTPTILRVIDSYGEPMTATEIATVMGVHQSKIHGALQIMTRDRLLVKSGFKYDIRKKEVKASV